MGRPKKEDTNRLWSEREEKAKLFAEKVTNEHKTIRQVAEEYHASKSTVHMYLKKYIDSKSLQDKINKELTNNFNTKHIRGGEATKRKFALEKKNKETTAKEKK